MRLSTYEIILPLVGTDEKPMEGYALLVNGLYGAMDVVPEDTLPAKTKRANWRT